MAAAGAVNWGFPTLADTDIPEILPTGICTYEHVVANVPHEEMVQKSVEIRGLKTTVSKIDIPCSFGPAYEGERVRGDDLFMQMGGGKTQATELVKMADMNAIEDGKVIVDGPDIADIKEGDTFPMEFVGRSREMAALHGLWRETVQGRSRVVVISGASGIGKSRLVFSLRNRAGLLASIYPMEW